MASCLSDWLRSEKHFHESRQPVAIDWSGVPGFPIKEAPRRGPRLDAEEHQKTPNLKPFQHLLVIGPHLAFQNVWDQELLGRDHLRRGIEHDLYRAAM